MSVKDEDMVNEDFENEELEEEALESVDLIQNFLEKIVPPSEVKIEFVRIKIRIKDSYFSKKSN